LAFPGFRFLFGYCSSADCSCAQRHVASRAAPPPRSAPRRRGRAAGDDGGGDVGGAESALVALPPPPRAARMLPAARRPPPLLLPPDADATWGVTKVPPGAAISPLLRDLPSGATPRDAATAMAAIASCRASGAASGAAATSAAYGGGRINAQPPPLPPPPSLFTSAITPFSAAIAAMCWPSPVAAAAPLGSRQASLNAILAANMGGGAGTAQHGGSAAYFDAALVRAMGAAAQAASTPGSASAERTRVPA